MVDTISQDDEWASSTEVDDSYPDDEDTQQTGHDSSHDQSEGNESAEEPVPPIEPAYANVVDFVEGYLALVIRRRVTDSDKGLSWDARWWMYPEVVARLTALHYAWEEARISDSAAAMSSWWIQHLEPHLRVILDSETGPMANARSDGSFNGWPALPVTPVPVDLMATLAGSDEE